MSFTDRRLHGNPRFLVRYPFARNPLVSRRNFFISILVLGWNVVKNGAAILFGCFICCDVASGCPVLLEVDALSLDRCRAILRAVVLTRGASDPAL
jgi:hypothetical protein